MSTFLTRDMRPSTSACAESAEEEPANASESEAPDADAIELEVEQSAPQKLQNVVQVASHASHSQSQSEVQDVDSDLI